MTPIQLLEEEKRREAEWVSQSAERFRANLEDGQSAMSPGGRRVLKDTTTLLTARLMTVMSDRERAGTNPLLPVIALLGPEHVALVTITTALALTWTGAQRKDVKGQTLTTHAASLGEALEHDLRFRLWRKDAPAAEKQAIERMKRDIEAHPRTWKRRAEQLRQRAGEPWSHEDHVVIGTDLFAALAEAAPQTFEAPVIRYGNKTLRLLKLTDAAAEVLTNITDAALVSAPRMGLMVVRPREWRYA